jgi:hypothetical protein
VAQTRRNDDRGRAAFRAQSGNQPGHHGCRRGDNREIRAIGEMIHAFNGRDTFDYPVMRINNTDRTAKSSTVQIFENCASDGMLPRAAADDNDRTGIKDTI